MAAPASLSASPSQSVLSFISNQTASLVSCALVPSQQRDCETCIAKGAECFWCGGTSECLDYRWDFPNCALAEVKYRSCWGNENELEIESEYCAFVNWSAVAIVVALVAGILLVAAIVACACVCCRLRAVRRRAKIKRGAKIQAREESSRASMAERHAERKATRDKEMDLYRQKYGIAKKPSSSSSPTPSKKKGSKVFKIKMPKF